MTSKLHIRVGKVEIRFEGSEEFIKDELVALVSAVAELTVDQEFDGGDDSHEDAGADRNGRGGESGGIVGTTNTIAAKVGGKTGPELAMAAAAHITFVRKQDRFSRSELLREMQSASSYYKKS